MRYLVTRNQNPVSLFDDFDSYFNGFFNHDFNITQKQEKFAVDVVKTEQQYSLTADLPGFKESEIEIQVDGSVLSISAHKEQEKKEEKESGYLLQERAASSYQRRFTLPEDANGEKIDAQIKNGQLLLSIPRAEKQQPKQIKIKSA